MIELAKQLGYIYTGHIETLVLYGRYHSAIELLTCGLIDKEEFGKLVGLKSI